jgi:hypothetical protein
VYDEEEAEIQAKQRDAGPITCEQGKCGKVPLVFASSYIHTGALIYRYIRVFSNR